MRTLRRAMGTLAAFASAACLVLGVGPPPIRAVDPLPLPSIDLGTPLPSIDLSTPLPSIDLGTPLPSIDLGTPLPSIDLGTPLPSVPPESASAAASPSTFPSLSSAEPAEALPTPSPSSSPDGLFLPRAGRSPNMGTVATSAETDGLIPGKPSVPELPPLMPGLPDAGSWLVPVIGVAVPALVVALVVAAQVIGGAAGLRIARGTLERIASIKPAWTRS
ncbi:MAG: hypothetical protein ACRDGB_09580 [Candidatus Limnocylindria bacterium]